LPTHLPDEDIADTDADDETSDEEPGRGSTPFYPGNAVLGAAAPASAEDDNDANDADHDEEDEDSEDDEANHEHEDDVDKVRSWLLKILLYAVFSLLVAWLLIRPKATCSVASGGLHS